MLLTALGSALKAMAEDEYIMLADAGEAAAGATVLLDMVSLAVDALGQVGEYTQISWAWLRVMVFRNDLTMLLSALGAALLAMVNDESILLAEAAAGVTGATALLDVVKTAVEALGLIAEYTQLRHAYLRVMVFRNDLVLLISMLGQAFQSLVAGEDQAYATINKDLTESFKSNPVAAERPKNDPPRRPDNKLVN